MAKWHGDIGFGELVETRPGVHEVQITTRHYRGDLIRNVGRNQASGNLNDDINISNKIAIVADAFANQNIQRMKYIEFMGSKWKISEIEVRYPELILTIGGVWNP